MGLEARCTARYGRRKSVGLARLETSDLTFRGDFRLAIRFADIRSVRVAGGTLRIETPEGVAAFELGPAAAKWAEKIRYPKPVIEKLGVEAGQVVSVLGVTDPEFLGAAEARGATVSVGRTRAASDLVFLQAARRSDLGRLAALSRAIRRDGAVWVVWKKGDPALKEDHVREAALAVGLVDVKVVAFSPTHSALKLVVPKAKR